jgi:hypothetical protein
MVPIRLGFGPTVTYIGAQDTTHGKNSILLLGYKFILPKYTINKIRFIELDIYATEN